MLEILELNENESKELLAGKFAINLLSDSECQQAVAVANKKNTHTFLVDFFSTILQNAAQTKKLGMKQPRKKFHQKLSIP